MNLRGTRWPEVEVYSVGVRSLNRGWDGLAVVGDRSKGQQRWFSVHEKARWRAAPEDLAWSPSSCCMLGSCWGERGQSDDRVCIMRREIEIRKQGRQRYTIVWKQIA